MEIYAAEAAAEEAVYNPAAVDNAADYAACLDAYDEAEADADVIAAVIKALEDTTK